MNIDFLNFDIFFLFKIGILAVIAGYIIFSLIVFNQTRVMEKIIKVSGASRVLEIVAIINLLLGFSLFVLALVIL